MKVEQWIKQNTESLSHKTIAVTGSTGGLGRALCRYLAELGASLLLLDRNAERSEGLRRELTEEFGISARCIGVDLSDIDSVRHAADALCREPIDVFIHNAGAYRIPPTRCPTGYNQVFQINFVSPYYLIRRLLPMLRERGGRVVAVGSIAHNYARADFDDIDFSKRGRASLLYGNAKRYLMLALADLFESKSEATLAITHPGISLTGITSHFPKPIFAVIRYPMRVIFMRPRKACLSILYGVLEPTASGEWIGPRWFDVWGFPRKKRLKTYSEKEKRGIAETAEKIYASLLEA